MRKSICGQVVCIGILMITVGLLGSTIHCRGTETGSRANYVTSKAPLRQTAFVHLPLGAVKPLGWLKDQLIIQRNGLTGYLWDGLFDGELWVGSQTNYEEGVVALAYILEDPDLLKMAKSYLEKQLSQDFDITMPTVPRLVMRCLMEYHEATGDPRVIDWMERFFDKVKARVKRGETVSAKDEFSNDQVQEGKTYGEYVMAAHWLYNRNGDKEMIEAVKHYVEPLSRTVNKFFLEFPLTRPRDSEPNYDFSRSRGMVPRGSMREWYFTTHGVQTATVIRHPAFFFLQTGQPDYKRAVFEGIERLDAAYGQVGGRFTGHEHFNILERGPSPTAGLELCAVAEYMLSMEKLFEIFGEVSLADRLELLAYNSFPGACTADMWAHQYDTQANQIDCSPADRGFDNRSTANIYGLSPHYNCCLYNMHQPWPRFVEHMWMASHDAGLAAVAYGPCQVKAKVADGVDIHIEEDTEYPFGGKIVFRIREIGRTVRFPLHLRIPAWAENAEIKLPDKSIYPEQGKMVIVEREWRKGDTIELHFPMKIRTEPRYNNSLAILRGPLYYVLRIGERFEELEFEWFNTEIRGDYPSYDWNIFPTTPWNYGLLIDTENPSLNIQVERNEISDVPWAQKGEPIFLKEPGLDRWRKLIWEKDEPIILHIKGQLIPEWRRDTVYPANAGDVPINPFAGSEEPIIELELVPYGSSRLRISEFPVIKK